MVQEFRVEGLGFGVWGIEGFRAHGFGFKGLSFESLKGLELRVYGPQTPKPKPSNPASAKNPSGTCQGC